MWLVGRRVIPWLLHYVAHTGSRELFRLAVLAIALGVAYGAATLFDVSFALGAFFAGMILSESDAEPARRAGDAAAAGCFRGAVLRLGRHAVRSVDHRAHPLPLLATLFIIIGRQIGGRLRASCGCSVTPKSTALMISASLAQIGEFSFILAGLGVALGAAADARARPDPCGRADLDPAQRRSCSPARTGSMPITSRRRRRPPNPCPSRNRSRQPKRRRASRCT